MRISHQGLQSESAVRVRSQSPTWIIKPWLDDELVALHDSRRHRFSTGGPVPGAMRTPRLRISFTHWSIAPSRANITQVALDLRVHSRATENRIPRAIHLHLRHAERIANNVLRESLHILALMRRDASALIHLCFSILEIQNAPNRALCAIDQRAALEPRSRTRSSTRGTPAPARRVCQRKARLSCRVDLE